MITSSHNSRLKHVRRLLADRRYRERHQAYVIESNRWLQELRTQGVRPELVLYTPEWSADPANVELLQALGAPQLVVEAGLLGAAADAVSPAGVLAVVPMQSLPLPATPGLLLVLDALGDPGNMGTMLRTAGAAGADGVLLGPGCVDVYNPKVVRSSMGAHLRLPLLPLDWAQIADRLAPLSTYLADTAGDLAYDEVDWRHPCAIIVGNEAHGASREARQAAQATVRIPMVRETESLNAAVSAAVILFEAARQRRRAGAS